MAEKIIMYSTNDCNIHEVSKKIISELKCDLVCVDESHEGKTVLLCFEEFYYRVSSYVSLTVLLSEEQDLVKAVIVGHGGGAGLLNISWGANKSITKEAEKLLNECGFKQQ